MRRYANLEEIMRQAVEQFSADVESGRYPSEDEGFHMSPEELDRLKTLIP